MTFVVEYAPDSADEGLLDLPRFVSLGWVVDRVTPKVRAEAEQLVRRIVTDLEGERQEFKMEIKMSWLLNPKVVTLL